MKERDRDRDKEKKERKKVEHKDGQTDCCPREEERLTERERNRERREKEREPLSIVYGQLAALMAISQSDHVVVLLIPPAFLFLLLFVTVPY